MLTLYNFVKNLVVFFLKIFFKIEIDGADNIPKEGRLILCANHSHFLDAIMISICTKRPIHFMAKKEVFDNKLIAWFLNKLNAFPVDRNATDIRAVKTSLRILKNNEVLGIFPEGTRVNSFDKNNAKTGIAMIALKSKSPVVPIYIDSNYKLFDKVNITVGESL